MKMVWVLGELISKIFFFRDRPGSSPRAAVRVTSDSLCGKEGVQKIYSSKPKNQNPCFVITNTGGSKKKEYPNVFETLKGRIFS